jgi:hypothetical protein
LALSLLFRSRAESGTHRAASASLRGADSVAKVGKTDLQRNDCSSMGNVLNLLFKVDAADESMLRAR